jgi:hypothetical protein
VPCATLERDMHEKLKKEGMRTSRNYIEEKFRLKMA